MPRSTLPTREALDNRLIVLIPAGMKRSLFEAAARSGKSAADLTREAIAAAMQTAA
jgi:hypothetical protein